MIKAVTKNTWELVVGGALPEIKQSGVESAESKAKRATEDKARYQRIKENSLND